MEQTNVKAQIGKRLYWLRKEKGWEIAELAKQTGISAASLSSYESEDVEPKVSALYQISETLGVSMDYLTGKTRQRTVKPSIYLRFDEIPEYLVTFKQAKDLKLDIPYYADVWAYVTYTKAPDGLIALYKKEQLEGYRGANK